MRGRPAVDAAALLARALRASAGATGVAAEVVDACSTPWSSATFTGERVALTLRAGDAAWLAALSEADLPMRGWFVADLTVEAAQDGVTAVEALVLLEA